MCVDSQAKLLPHLLEMALATGLLATVAFAATACWYIPLTHSVHNTFESNPTSDDKSVELPEINDSRKLTVIESPVAF